ncbi:MAG: tRNA (adenosine(37)-N6)-threonylcarbamoyltransferase complex ATPase subunit type 1 TsaE [Erysipelotrichia bacterium]|nr:tRNA (adenosine(37)-N6)-threonylcarbamoyltransferase complex ATPase subunit type 1 TsaE [Erysipelotrichia bacterium]NCC55379.1 tRNA (adenosine(37)-N6)-threonylcarbamoyltransferase complex ATPase subunit type 1 TsaE [Erysipelotrichia bacterium]
MKEIRVKSLEETNLLAEKIASLLPIPALITLSGDLGAGKTTFTKGLAKALGIHANITSPTFTILKSYEEKITLHHIDAYRLEGITQDLGFEEIFDEDAVCVVEWFDYIEYALPKNRLQIAISLDGEERIFKIEAIGEQYIKLVEALS